MIGFSSASSFSRQKTKVLFPDTEVLALRPTSSKSFTKYFPIQYFSFSFEKRNTLVSSTEDQ